MPQLSVIILNYKVPYFLMLCLDSVQKSLQGIKAEIIVVDNHSEDGSCQLVSTYFPEVKLIQNTENYGFSKGNNIGIEQAEGKYICILNPDSVVSENTFKNVLHFAQTHSDFGILGPRLIDGSGHFLRESKRNIPTLKIALKKLFNHAKEYYASLPQEEVGSVPVLAGSFMFIQKDRYFEIGKLDEDYFMYGEDIDLSYQFIQSGYTNYYLGNEKTMHFKGESTPKDAVHLHYFYQAMVIFYQKHLQKNNLTGMVVKFGAKLAQVSHSVRKKKESKITANKGYYWVGEKTPFTEKLIAYLNTAIKVISLEELYQNPPSSATLFFDAEQINYETIIQLIHKLKDTQNRFRIKPARFSFIAGSDRRTDKGQIILLK